MIVELNIDELRSFASCSAEIAEKMSETNNLISTIVSKHDWQCPERVLIDESLDRIKENAQTLDIAFQMYSSKIIELANGYTDFNNEQIKSDAIYMSELANDLADTDACVLSVNSGSNFAGVVSGLESSSSDISNTVSLHGASQAISIIDFSSYSSES